MISFSLSAIIAATTVSDVTFKIVLNISTNLSKVNSNEKPITSCSGVKPIPFKIKAIVIKPAPGMPAEVDEAIIAKNAISLLGYEKFMFATDYPMWNANKEIETLLSLNLTEQDYNLIFSENAKKVYKL